MATIYSIAGSDGYVGKSGTTSWTDSRDDINGTATGRNDKKYPFATWAFHFPGRGGGATWRVFRSFLWFDTSGISEAPSSATLKVYGYSRDTADIFAVKATHSLEFTNADFDAITGWNNSGVDNESNVTKYSSEITSWSTSGYNDIALNATALSDMASLDDFKICLIESVHDLRNSEPSLEESFEIGMHYSDQSGTSNDPYVDYTVAGGVAVTGNAPFFGTNF